MRAGWAGAGGGTFLRTCLQPGSDPTLNPPHLTLQASPTHIQHLKMATYKVPRSLEFLRCASPSKELLLFSNLLKVVIFKTTFFVISNPKLNSFPASPLLSHDLNSFLFSQPTTPANLISPAGCITELVVEQGNLVP